MSTVISFGKQLAQGALMLGEIRTLRREVGLLRAALRHIESGPLQPGEVAAEALKKSAARQKVARAKGVWR
jgi:hypothetical protein